MRYTIARYKEKQRDDVYRIYVTDSLRILTENSASIASMLSSYLGCTSEGYQYIPNRYYDILHPSERRDADGNSVAADFIKRAGLSFAEGGE